jgi:hypothetical protein
MTTARIQARIAVAERKIAITAGEGAPILVFGEAALSDSEWCERLQYKRQQMPEGTRIVGIRFVSPVSGNWPDCPTRSLKRVLGDDGQTT